MNLTNNMECYMVNRVRPSDIGQRLGNVKLAKKRKKEVRCDLYLDQIELVQDWCTENSTSVTNIMRKLFNYFLHSKEAKRQNILRNY